MKTLAVIALAGTLAAAASAQVMPNTLGVARSFSGQFTVRGVPPDTVPSRADAWAADTNIISLEPALLVVSCERIKQGLWRELGVNGAWHGRVELNLFPARTASDEVTLAAERSPNGWNYRAALPDVMARNRFVREVTRVLLLELANRNAGEHSAELPAWLVEGLTQQLLAGSQLELLLPPPRWDVRGLTLNSQVSDVRRLQPLAQAKKNLDVRPALTFEELSWPERTEADVFRSSAQLFVSQLLRFNDGPACLRAMLERLPRFYNWQTAFLDAFAPHFTRQLDVEKWWALQVADFTGRDLAQTWTPAESWRKLDELLQSSVQIRVRPDELPERGRASLQTVLRDADVLQQSEIVPRKIQELDGLRLRVAPSLVPLVDEYRRALLAFRERRQQTSLRNPLGKRGLMIPDRAMEETVCQLDALDERRAALRPGTTSTGVPAPR